MRTPVVKGYSASRSERKQTKKKKDKIGYKCGEFVIQIVEKETESE